MRKKGCSEQDVGLVHLTWRIDADGVDRPQLLQGLYGGHMGMYYPNDETQHGKCVYNWDCIQSSGLGNLVSSNEGLYLIAKDADTEAYSFGSLRIPGP